ncbi:hypothetical protein [Actinopolyspora mortivallis]|uniref:hypothetical protein n=1 Tax=Actinopolyspora mortivallis TaxID=33906 RepID=UPI00038013D8|nr:hypothetical protein [Actinopolyspora mortivallis]
MPKTEFRTRKDGTVYPIRGKRGGKLLGAGVAAVLVYSGGTTGSLSLGGAAGGTGSAELSAADSAVVRTVRRNTARSKQLARQGKRSRTWSRMRLRRGNRTREEAAECALFSHGQVREFFLEHPCRRLDRVQFPLTDRADNTVTVLVSWVRMRGRGQARRLRNLIDVHGTGDIRPVLPGTRFTGHHYDSKPRGDTLVVAEAEPVRGRPPRQVLRTVPEVAVELPPPGRR